MKVKEIDLKKKNCMNYEGLLVIFNHFQSSHFHQVVGQITDQQFYGKS